MILFLIDLTPPTSLLDQNITLQLVVWLFGLMVIGLATMLRVLWLDNKEHIKYIRDQEKENILLLNELLNVSKASGIDVTNVTNLLLTHLKPNQQEMLTILRNIQSK